MNTTFTAGGLTSPIFVVVYGLGSDEMPFEDIITVPLQGLTVAGDRNIYSVGTGYITFVCGKYNSTDIPSEDNQDSPTDDRPTEDTFAVNTISESSEAKIAQLYCQLIYHPFIHKIRTTVYNMPDDGPIPDSHRAISWMDGANSQIKSITLEDNLKKEEEKKITCCKHSAARTTVEQPADAAPNFKVMKQVLRRLENPQRDSNCFLYELEIILKRLEDGDIGERKIVRLRAHKKKAILDTVTILPEATGTAYTVENVKKGFLLTGMIDSFSNSVPSLDNLFHTYRGNLENTCLEDRNFLVRKFFEEMHSNGCINEISYDNNSIPKDIDSHGKIVERNNDPKQENRQRAKILSSKAQISQRRHLLDKKRMSEYNSRLQWYRIEEKEAKLNLQCERKFAYFIFLHRTKRTYNIQELSEDGLYANYVDVSDDLTPMILNKHKSNVTNDELRAFI